MIRMSVLVACLLVIAGAGPILAQGGPPSLPSDVSEWMEQDQVFRWATLIETGQGLFAEGTCTRCHQEGGVGSPRAPDLTDGDWLHGDGSLAGIQDVIFWGVKKSELKDPERPFAMNPEGGMNLEWDEVRALAAYVWSLSNGTFIPGRGDGP